MKEQLLVEINRNREIMGLGRLLSEQEKEKIANSYMQEVLDAFKTTPKNERESLKTTIIKGLQQNKEKLEITDEEIADASNKMDEFMNVEEVEVEGEVEEQITADNILRNRAVNDGSSQYAYSKISGRRSKCKDAYGFKNKALCLLKKLFKLGTGIEVWGGSAGVDVNIPIRKGYRGADAKLSSLDNASPTIPEAEWDKYYDDYNKKFVKRITTDRGKLIWETHWTAEEGKYKPFVIVCLEKFNEFRNKKGGKKVQVSVNDKPKETIKKGKVIPAPVIPLQFPVDAPPSAQYFVDNCYETTPVFTEQIDKLIEGVIALAQGKEAPEGKKQFWLAALEIGSSCSAVPNGTRCGNTTLSKPMTFPELAEARANAAKEYLMEKLKEINCGFGVYNDDGDETKITINSKGENGDGTSGPAWDPELKKYYDTWKKSVAENGVEKATTGEGEEIDKIFKGYEQSKMVQMGVSIIVNTQDKGQETTEPDEVIFTDKLAVFMEIPGKGSKDLGFGWKWPVIKWRPFTLIRRLFRKKVMCFF